MSQSMFMTSVVVDDEGEGVRFSVSVCGCEGEGVSL